MSDLIREYTIRYNSELKPLASALETFLQDRFLELDSVCFLRTRAKTIDRFMQKAERQMDGQARYDDPMNQIQDQIGGLIVTRFVSDVAAINTIVDESFRGIEKQRLEPESDFEFGYIGDHFILFLPLEVTSEITEYDGPDFFELQIKTLFQYAWSETNHAIGYERSDQLNREQKRMTAYIAAQAWGADKAVDELRADLESRADAELH